MQALSQPLGLPDYIAAVDYLEEWLLAEEVW